MVTEKMIAAAIEAKKTPKEIADAINVALWASTEAAKISKAMALAEQEYRKSVGELEAKSCGKTI